jgi:Skp family chaperone for outer membrane proteins
MKNLERTFIYAALIVLIGFNTVLLLSHSGQNAMAEAAAWLSDLGPADSLKLMDNDKELVIRNKAQRIAWGDDDFRRTYTVGFVDIGRVLNPLMESAAFSEEREALRKELDGTEQDYRSKLEAMVEQLQGMERDNPQTKEKFDEYRKLYDEYMKWAQETALPRRNELDVKHLQQAYRELTSAVNVVADKMGVDIVLRFIPTDKDFKAANAEQGLTEIRLRTAVKYPEKLDITNEVMQELSLKDKEG